MSILSLQDEGVGSIFSLRHGQMVLIWPAAGEAVRADFDECGASAHEHGMNESGAVRANQRIGITDSPHVTTKATAPKAVRLTTGLPPRGAVGVTSSTWAWHACCRRPPAAAYFEELSLVTEQPRTVVRVDGCAARKYHGEGA